MFFRRLASATLAVAFGLGTAGHALAEDVSVSSEDLSRLLERLEAAEQRIQELEAAQKASTRKAAVPVDVLPSVASDPDASVENTSFVDHDDDPIVKRLETLENKWVNLEESHKGLSEQIDDYFIKDGSSNTNMTISGRIHADYWAFPDTDAGAAGLEGQNPQDRFYFRRVRFGVKGKVRDNMHYKIEMEFADPNNTQYRDLYIGFDELPLLQTVRIGNQKRPFGLDHINSSRFNVFMERPFIIESFNQDARRLGVVSYGKTDDLAWNWRYGVYNMELTQGDPGYRGDHYQLQMAGRLANTAYWDESTDGRSYIHWAVSAMAGWPDSNGGPGGNLSSFDTRPEARTNRDWLDTDPISGADDYQQLGFESVLNFGPLQLVGELEQTWVDRTSSPSLYFWGGYVYAAYFLTGEHMPWDRKTGQLARPKPFQNFFMVNTCDGCVDSGWGAWQIAARWSFADLSDENIQGGVGESLTIGLNWYWNPNARLQFNYINGNIVGNVPNPGNDSNYDIIGTRFMVDF